VKRQEFLTGSMALGPFLASLLASRDHEFESNGLPNERAGVSTADIALSRGERDVAGPHFARPRVVTPGPMLRLLMMLLSRNSRRERLRWQGPTLPPGCVMVVRYVSR
jgi:hypothetical protein